MYTNKQSLCSTITFSLGTNWKNCRRKRAHPNDKQKIDETVQSIIQNPIIGILKKGALSDVRVHKFKTKHQLILLGYVFNTTNNSTYCPWLTREFLL